MTFEFASPTRILFGCGTFRQVAPLASELGTRVLLVTGRRTPGREALQAELARRGLHTAVFQVSGEPTTDRVVAGTELAKAEQCDLVISLGGGSVIDAAKAIAGLITNGGDVYDYLEVIGRGRTLSKPCAPTIAVPTTAGAGAEVTRNAVLASPCFRVKASLRSPLLLAKVAVVDPELTYDLPPELTASTGLDALTQLIEPYVSHRAHPLTDGFCVEGMRRVARSIERAFHDPKDAPAREDMAFASLLGGLSLANAGLGAVHGFAAPIGGAFPAPHGAVCAALLPHVMATNLAALRQREPSHPALGRYQEVARILTGDPTAIADAGVEWTNALVKRLKIPGLRTYGISEKDFDDLVSKATQASSMKANPIVLTRDELRTLLARAL